MIFFKRILSAVVLISVMATSCNTVDDEVIEPVGQNLYEVDGRLECALSESCQDVYEIEFEMGSQISIEVSSITENSVIRMAIYAPNSLLGGTNLLTNNSKEIECWGQEEDVVISNFQLLNGGKHKIAITRDWGSSAGFNGDYKLTIISSLPFKNISQIVEGEASQASGSTCPA